MGAEAGEAGAGRLTYLLDSVILIDHFNGCGEATRYLARTGGRAAVSVITRAEVLADFAPIEEAAATGLLDRFPTLGIDKPVADLAARLRREHRWKMPDALQAALASYHGLKLVTRNTRDFPPERHCFVVVPYTLGN
jgi:predicted nucleic acid-binding protein